MNETEIRRAVMETLAEIVPEANLQALKPEKNFRDQIDMDSVDFLNFVLSLEKRLQVSIPEPDYPKFSSLDGCTMQLSERTSPR